MTNYANPDSVGAPFHLYSQVSVAGDLVSVAGQVGVDRDNKVVGPDVTSQASGRRKPGRAAAGRAKKSGIAISGPRYAPGRSRFGSLRRYCLVGRIAAAADEGLQRRRHEREAHHFHRAGDHQDRQAFRHRPLRPAARSRSSRALRQRGHGAFGHASREPPHDHALGDREHHSNEREEEQHLRERVIEAGGFQQQREGSFQSRRRRARSRTKPAAVPRSTAWRGRRSRRRPSSRFRAAFLAVGPQRFRQPDRASTKARAESPAAIKPGQGLSATPSGDDTKAPPDRSAAEREPHPERRADQGHAPGPRFERGHVGDVGLGGRDRRAGDARADPRDEQQRQALARPWPGRTACRTPPSRPARPSAPAGGRCGRRAVPTTARTETACRKAGHQQADRHARLVDR